MGLKRISATMAAVLAIVLMPVTAMADSEEPWEFEGGGWGHGIGLSQFGALGQAEEGRKAKEILQFYYEGTDVVDGPDHWTNDPDGLWVGLKSNTTSVALTAVGGHIKICQPSDTCPPEPPYAGEFNDTTISPDENWVFEVDDEDSSQCRFRKEGAEEAEDNLVYRECDAALTKDENTDVRFVVNGTQYARGTIRMTESSGGFHVVVTLPMEEYLYGLAEVPSSWPDEALKAQAIIGRSFALATAAQRSDEDGNKKWSVCGCHIRSTTADQAYNGWAKESGEHGDRWVAAVDDTNPRILTHPESNQFADVAKAFYSSSNGGASENNEDVWPGEPIPWLRSVEDPWSADPNINPLANWSVKVDDSLMAAYFGWDRALDAFKLQGPPDVLVRFTGKKGGEDVEAVLNGTEIATLLKTIGHGYEPVLGGNTSIRVSPYISSVTDPPGFDDIVGHTFETAIEWMLAEEITVGCNPPDNTRYCPDESVTRGQMAVFISRVLGLPSPSGDHFGDDDGDFYESAANRLFEAGITVGCDDGRFCGDERMTRGQMSAFVVRAKEDLPDATQDYFVDDDTSIFEKAINQMAESKITLGCNPPENDRYCPNNDVTRGQMAAFFRRAWGP